MSAEDSRGKDSSVPLRVLAAMMEGRCFDVASVMNEYSVAKGTANRCLSDLKKWIPEVARDKSAKRHTFWFDSSRFREPERKDEPTNLAGAIAVSLASAFSRVFDSSHYQISLLQLRKLLIDNLPEARQPQFAHASRKFVTLGGFEEGLDDRSGLLDDVLDAILKSKQLKIEYEKFGDKTRSIETRTIEPYTLAIHDSHFYVIGVDAGSPPSRLRTFRFSRILEAEVLDVSFKYPAPNEYDPAAAFRDSIGIWGSSIEPVRVRVRLSSNWCATAQHHRWHASQRTDPSENDKVELSFLVRPCPEFEKWVLGFGNEAEVLEPASLREKVAERLRQASSSYA